MKTTKLMHAVLMLLLCAGINAGASAREFNPPENAVGAVDLRLASHG
jgi:hypothetical protein